MENPKAEADRIQNERGRIISNFAYLESIISLFIAISYCPPGDKQRIARFTEEVLEHKFFSFELKKSIFYRILKERFSETSKAFPKNKLDKMQELRNIFAHGLIIGKGNQSGIFEIDFKHAGSEHPADDLIRTYDGLKATVEPILQTLPGIKTTRISN